MSFRYEKAVELLEQAHQNGRLAHAYLITGPSGSGKERLAIHLHDLVNTPDMIPSAESVEELKSDVVAVVGPESKSRRITVKAVRALEHTLRMAVAPGLTKHAIIRDADCMGVEAENALLKTLEEPPAGSRLLLLTSRPEMLLETILSRCIRVPLAGAAGAAVLSEPVEGFLESLAEHALAGRSGISGALGLVSRFSSLLGDAKAEITKEYEEQQKAEVALYKNRTEGDYLKQREEYFKAVIEADYLEARSQMIEALVMWFGDAVRQQQGGTRLDLPGFASATAKLAKVHSLDALLIRLEAVETLRSHLTTNVHESLAMEVAFIRAFG